MDAGTHNLHKLLSFERRYIVPTYQRHYEWTEKDQWELLFDDLESRVDDLTHARTQASLVGESVAKAEAKVQSHFLGAIVLEGLPHTSGSLALCHIIDGQQRLTTLQLLCRGVLDVLVERQSPRAPQLVRLIQNPDDAVQEPEDRYKLWPNRRDRDVWRIAMANEIPTEGGHPYLEARAYFAKRTREAIVAENGTDRTDALVDALRSHFKLVVIDLDASDDAQVIFEVLNARQTRLSATDLVKNLIFLRAELSHDEVETLYQEHWAQFDDRWWETSLGTGHAARGRRDVLLSSWLAARTCSDVNVEHLYGEVRRHLDDTKDTIPQVLATLRASAEAFRRIFERPASLPLAVQQAYERITRLKVTTALPLLVWLGTQPSTVLPAAEHQRAVAAIDAWIVRRVLVRANSRDYAKRFIEVLTAAQEAPKAGKPIARAIEESLALAGAEASPWPTDEDIEEAFVDNRFYDRFPPERIRMVLGALDAKMHSDNHKGEQPVFNYDSLQIEHIMPDEWREHWPLPSADPAQQLLLGQRRDQLKHRIGNLTLVTAPLNPAMSNGPWPLKRAALDAHSNLRLNAAIRSIDQWSEQHIEQRARELARVACRVWQRPNDLPERVQPAGPESDAQQASSKVHWDWPRLQARLEEEAGPEAVQGANRIKDWAEAHASGVYFMTNQTGSFIPLFPTSHPFYPIKVAGNGKVVFQMNNLAKKGPFASPQFKQAFLAKLNEELGKEWGPEQIAKRPRISLAQLAEEERWRKFTNVLEWLSLRATKPEVLA